MNAILYTQSSNRRRNNMEIFILCVLLLLTSLHFSPINGQIYDVIKFGAKGDGKTDDSEAFVNAWKAMCGSGGKSKTLVIPQHNTFLLQPLEFQGPCKSPLVEVKVIGKIVAPINKVAWSNHKSLNWITFNSIIGLMVSGSGSIDGRGSSFWQPKSPASRRPTQLHFRGCNDLKITGITSFNSPRNHISISECNNVKISLIKLIAPGDSPNTDGIDISKSRDVDIYDTNVGTGDDCVAINSGSININITRMSCGPGHGISVGSLGRDGELAAVENIQVTNCTFNGTENGARVKTWPNGKGYARNIIFQDIKLINTKNPIIIDQQYIDRGRYDVEESAVAISNVTFADISGTSQSDDVIKINCSDIIHCEAIVLENINISTVDGNKPVVACSNVFGKFTNAQVADGCFQ